MVTYIALMIVVTGLASAGYWFFSKVKEGVTNSDAANESHQPAGFIHLFQGDRRLVGTPTNPFDNDELDWGSGKLSAVLWEELQDYPHYFPAVIGTVEITKPEIDYGRVVALLDNSKVTALGYSQVGVMDGVERAISSRRQRQAQAVKAARSSQWGR